MGNDKDYRGKDHSGKDWDNAFTADDLRGNTSEAPAYAGALSFLRRKYNRDLAGINLVGMDIVEVAPAYDVGEITALAAASLAMEFLCLYAANPRRQPNTRK